MEISRETYDRITEKIIGFAIKIHKSLGPGLLESTYEACLCYELARAGMRVQRQKALPVIYEGVKLDCGYRLDLIVDGLVIVEIKAVETIAAIHEAQLLSYLRLSGCRLGLLINFNVKVLKTGIRRIVNNLCDSPRPLRSQR